MNTTKIFLFALVVLSFWILPVQDAASQGLVSDLLSGKLIKPAVGQWLWYDLKDKTSGERVLVRQAIVGEERVGRLTGYWMEFEIVPEVGFRDIYKVLLTGPASDPEHIRRVFIKHGLEPAHEQEIVRKQDKGEKTPNPKRKSIGKEIIPTGQGPLEAERFQMQLAERFIDIWVNEDIRPTGIVRMVTPDGEMTLRSHGTGGEYAESAIDKASASKAPEVNVIVDNGVSTESSAPTTEASPKASADADKPAPEESQ